MLKYICYISLTFILFACNEKQDTFKDLNGGFAIAFNAEPQLTIDTFETELGAVVLYSYMEEISNSNAQMLTYSDYPISENYISDPYKFIKGAKDGALKSLNIKNILFEEQFSLDDVPGIEVRGTNNDNLYIHYKLFLKGNRLYQIGILKEGGEQEAPKDLEFMESFVFL